MRIFIAGNRGQLGCDCSAVLGTAHEVFGSDLPELDIADMASVVAACADGVPDVIVNCAAFTKVDACETEIDAARSANSEGPAVLARYARESGIFLVHVSTDYVFDGARPVPQPYTEEDATHPVSAYGRTKLDGEVAVQRTHADHAILRTAWLYGASGHNFLKTILRVALARPDRPLRVVSDQYGSPTWSLSLARQIARVVECHATGLFHATAEGCCTWYEFASAFLESMGVSHEIQPCTSAEYPTPARRPANSILENGQLKKQGIHVMRPWQDDMAEFVARHREALLADCAPG